MGRAPTQIINIKQWSDFEGRLKYLHAIKNDCERTTGSRWTELLFRGHSNSKWPLQTTLERSFPLERSENTLSFVAYYRKIAASKPAIVTLTDKSWSDVPNWPTFQELLRQHNRQWLDAFLNKNSGIYQYLVYLRHHGFPSPLLDWTASPYVAALFALDTIERQTTHVCVYAFMQNTLHSISADRHFFVVGPYIESHRRHYVQQSRYSMCVETNGDDYTFHPHESGMNDSNVRLFKIRIPASERAAGLKQLDQMNINPYSLFGSDDALIKTIARRECFFRTWS